MAQVRDFIRLKCARNPFAIRLGGMALTLFSSLKSLVGRGWAAASTMYEQIGNCSIAPFVAYTVTISRLACATRAEIATLTVIACEMARTKLVEAENKPLLLEKWGAYHGT